MTDFKDKQKRIVERLLNCLKIKQIRTEHAYIDLNSAIIRIEDYDLCVRINDVFRNFNFYKNHYVLIANDFFVGINDNRITVGKTFSVLPDSKKIDCDVTIKL